MDISYISLVFADGVKHFTHVKTYNALDMSGHLYNEVHEICIITFTMTREVLAISYYEQLHKTWQIVTADGSSYFSNRAYPADIVVIYGCQDFCMMGDSMDYGSKAVIQLESITPLSNLSYITTMSSRLSGIFKNLIGTMQTSIFDHHRNYNADEDVASNALKHGVALGFQYRDRITIWVKRPEELSMMATVCGQVTTTVQQQREVWQQHFATVEAGVVGDVVVAVLVVAVVVAVVVVTAVVVVDVAVVVVLVVVLLLLSL